MGAFFSLYYLMILFIVVASVEELLILEDDLNAKIKKKIKNKIKKSKGGGKGVRGKIIRDLQKEEKVTVAIFNV